MIKKIFYLNLKLYRRILRTILYSFFYTTFIFSANQTIGSDSSVDFSQAHIIFDGGNNRIATYALMDNGFSMTDNNTDLIFDSVFPVSQDLFFRGKELHLEKDFIFTGNKIFLESVVINGNNHNFVISNKVKDLSSLLSLNYTTSVNVGGNVDVIAWSLNDPGYIVVANPGAYNAVQVYYFDGTILSLQTGDFADYDAPSLRQKPFSSSAFAVHLIKYGPTDNNVWLFHYDSAANAIIGDDYHDFGADIIQALAWYSDGTAIAVGRDSTTEKITVWEVNSSNAFTGNYITNVANSNVSTSANLTNDSLDFDPTGQYLVVGFNDTTDSLDDLVLYSFDKQTTFTYSTLTYLTGINLNASVTDLDWSPTGPFIAVAIDDGAQPYITCYEYDSSKNSLNEIDNIRVYSNSTNGDVKWSADGKYLSVGRDSGTDNEFGVYFFDDINKSLSLVDELEIGSTVKSTAFSPNQTYVAQGGEAQSLNIYDFTAERPYFYFENTNIIFEGDFTINVPVKFSGHCSINGNGNSLFFNEDGSMSQSNSGLDLELRNVVLNSFNINNVTGDDYNLILDDAIIKLDSDFCFNGAGELGIYNDVLVTGTHTFCLDGTCKIYDNAKLMFDIGTTFSMGLHSNIMMMNNKTGSIYFNGSNIIVLDADFSIDYGRIIFENEVTITDYDATVIGGGKAYGEFVIGANTGVDVLGNAQIVLENTTTFSIL